MSSPSQHPGERLASYFDKFFTTVVGVSTLGASITFAKVVQTPVKPWVDYGVSIVTIQNHLSIAFLLFLIDLAVTSVAASALSLYRLQAVEYFGTEDSRKRRVVMWWATIVSVVLFGLLFTAFMFLGLVMVAYTGPIGWVAVAFLSLFGLVVLGTIVWQSPIGSPSPEEARRREDYTHHRYDSSSEVSSPERGHDLRPPYAAVRDDDFYDEKARDWYKDGISTRMPANTIPGFEPVVPPYMTDLRRLRSLRAEKESRYQARRETRREERKQGSEIHMHTHSPRY
ncbi:hypothetical protein VTK56DRAFT_8903 [Thermocarpiscus australiensis]